MIFWKRCGILSVTLGYNLEKIGANAFCNCKNLKSIYGLENVRVIGNNAFKGDKSLTAANLSGARTIGKNAFSGCTALKSVKLGGKLTAIADGVFQNCTALKKITIPAKVTKIGAKAFCKCKALAGITVKAAKIKTVGKDAFKGISKKVVFSCPTKKLAKNYKKIFQKAGAPKSGTWK